MKSDKKVTPSNIKKEIPKRILVWDIETSFNICWSWSLGNRISLTPDNLIKERAIICIAYKYLGESKVHSIHWNKGNDKELCKKFAKVLEGCTHTLAHNGDNFDSKLFLGRCLYHGVTLKNNPKKIDTLKMARRHFRLNSNKLNYLGQFLGLGQKRDTGGLKTWVDIIMKNSTKALNKMVFYCKGDVILLEKIYNKLDKYSVKK